MMGNSIREVFCRNDEFYCKWGVMPPLSNLWETRLVHPPARPFYPNDNVKITLPMLSRCFTRVPDDRYWSDCRNAHASRRSTSESANEDLHHAPQREIRDSIDMAKRLECVQYTHRACVAASAMVSCTAPACRPCHTRRSLFFTINMVVTNFTRHHHVHFFRRCAHHVASSVVATSRLPYSPVYHPIMIVAEALRRCSSCFSLISTYRPRMFSIVRVSPQRGT